MWKIRKFTEAKRAVLSVSGRIEAEELLELQNAVSSEETALQKVELDLENVRLVDQQAVTFLASLRGQWYATSKLSFLYPRMDREGKS